MNPESLKQNFTNFINSPFRPYQEDTINFVTSSKKPISIIWAPTGFGKTVSGACIGSAYQNFTYLVSSKQLQDQINDDFPEIQVLKGRNNYPCNLNSGLTCSDCIHGSIFKCPYKADSCEYEEQKKLVLSSPYRLLNYAYFMVESNYIGRFSDQKILLCDEGDLVESLITDFISLSVPGYVLKNLKIKPPKYKSADRSHKLIEWIEWGKKEVGPKVLDGLSNLKLKIKSLGKNNPDLPKLLKREQILSTMSERINIFTDHVDDTWIFEERKSRNPRHPNTLTFRPIWTPEELSEKYFFRHSEKFVFLSATFPPSQIMGILLGRNPDDMDYIDVPSTFPEENRKVYLNPVGNLTAKTFDIEAPKIVDEIKNIINLKKHKSSKGLIHSVSYKLANLIMDIGDDRLITHDSSNREKVIESFKNSPDPLVLVSPSLERGLDLPDDLCRFVIWAKCPYLSLGDKLTSRRVYSGRLGALWYKSLAAQTIVQGIGRGVRSATDYCETYILDKQARDLILKNRILFPGYFYDALEAY